jgi:hypothetical protein
MLGATLRYRLSSFVSRFKYNFSPRSSYFFLSLSLLLPQENKHIKIDARRKSVDIHSRDFYFISFFRRTKRKVKEKVVFIIMIQKISLLCVCASFILSLHYYYSCIQLAGRKCQKHKCHIKNIHIMYETSLFHSEQKQQKNK